MQPIAPITACPHCGGRSGFQTKIQLVAVRMYDWSAGEVDTDAYEVKNETNPICSDCGKSVRTLMN